MLELPEGGEVHLGSGLRPVGDDVVALKCGVVRQTQRGKLWLEGRQKRCVLVLWRWWWLSLRERLCER